MKGLVKEDHSKLRSEAKRKLRKAMRMYEEIEEGWERKKGKGSTNTERDMGAHAETLAVMKELEVGVEAQMNRRRQQQGDNRRRRSSRREKKSRGRRTKSR